MEEVELVVLLMLVPPSLMNSFSCVSSFSTGFCIYSHK